MYSQQGETTCLLQSSTLRHLVTSRYASTPLLIPEPIVLDRPFRVETGVPDMASQYPPETHGGIVTSWIPVTSAWPSSPGCESKFWSVVESTLAAWDPGYGISVDRAVTCLPPAQTSWWDANWLGGNGNTQLSLGPCRDMSHQVTWTTCNIEHAEQTSYKEETNMNH